MSSLEDGVGAVLVRVVAIFAFRVVDIGVVVAIFFVVVLTVAVDVCTILNVLSISLGKYGFLVVFSACPSVTALDLCVIVGVDVGIIIIGCTVVFCIFSLSAYFASISTGL